MAMHGVNTRHQLVTATRFVDGLSVVIKSQMSDGDGQLLSTNAFGCHVSIP